MFYVFDAEQRDELRSHLSKDIPESQLDSALKRLDMVCDIARMNHRDVRRDMAYFRKHSVAIVKHGEALAKLLDGWRSSVLDGQALAKLADDWRSGDAVDIDLFLQQLQRIIDDARVDAAAWAPRTLGRGNRSNFLRDQLILTTFAVYGASATKTMDGNCEKTIRLLLRYIDQEIDDVHGLVIDVFKRGPTRSLVILDRTINSAT